MTDSSLSIQDVFLKCCEKEKTSVTVYLVNGVKLQGEITGSDSSSVILQRNQHSQLIYKHSVATVVPSSAIDFNPDDYFQEPVQNSADDRKIIIDDSESFEIA